MDYATFYRDLVTDTAWTLVNDYVIKPVTNSIVKEVKEETSSWWGWRMRANDKAGAKVEELQFEMFINLE